MDGGCSAIAHVREDGEFHDLEQHLRKVAKRASALPPRLERATGRTWLDSGTIWASISLHFNATSAARADWMPT